MHQSHVYQSLLAREIWLDHERLQKQGGRGKALALSRRGEFDVANEQRVEGVRFFCDGSVSFLTLTVDPVGERLNFCRCCSGAHPDNNGIVAKGWMKVEGQGERTIVQQ